MMSRQEVHIAKTVLLAVCPGHCRVRCELLFEVCVFASADLHFMRPLQETPDRHMRRYSWDRPKLPVDHDGSIRRQASCILTVERVSRPLLGISPALEIAE